MNFKSIFFDFNGVICDDENIHFEIFQELLMVEGLAITREEYFQDLIGLDDRACIREVYRRYKTKLDSKKMDYIIQKKNQIYHKKIVSDLVVFPGAINTVKKIYNKIPLAIISGALRNEIVLVLNKMDIFNCFEFIIAAEDIQNSKPDPEGYLLALSKMRNSLQTDIKANECLVIEDTVAGVEAAKNAGMVCLAVTNSYEASALSYADHIVDTLEDNLIWELIGI